MKTKLKGLALTAMLLSSTSITHAEQGANSVGDLPGFNEEAYFHEDATYAANARTAPVSHAGDGGVGVSHAAVSHVGDTHVGHSHVGDMPMHVTPEGHYQAGPYPSIGMTELQSPSFSDLDAAYVGGSYGCDSGCDSAFEKKRKWFSLFDRCGDDCWGTTEGLVWFTPNRDMPALITTSDPGTLPVLPQGGTDNVQVVFGDEIQGEIAGGLRMDYGKYLTKNIGIGGRGWWINNSTDSYFASGDGSGQSIGRPFYNIDVPANDALLVAFDPTFSGTIAAQSELSLWGAEAYARVKMSCNRACRLELIGGYSHFEIDDTLGISSTTLTNATARIRQYADLFETENRFDGGQVGFEMVMNHGRWTARSLTKVHLGNMNQRVQIQGISSDQTPPAPADVTSGGLLAMGNQGDYERDVFSFVPEANFKVGYRLHNNVALSVGYSLIYWDNVALVGDVIDPTADGSALNTGIFGNRPEFEFNDSSLWVQGVDFGVVIDL